MNRRISALKSAVALLSLIIAQPVAAQNVKPGEKIVSTTAQEVLVDVVVRDKKGHPVTDLTAENFSVYDNNDKKAIKTLRLVQGTEGITNGTRTQLDPLRQVRLVSLIFENLDINSRRLARDAALELLKTDLPQNVYMAVMVIGHKLEAIQPFTNDRDLLKKAIDRAASGEKTDFSADTAHVESQLEQILGPSAGGNGSLEERLNSQTASASASASGGSPDGTKMANLAMAQMMLTTLRTEQSNAMSEAGRAQIFSLFDAVKQQYQLPGRKTIVFFSDGLNVPQGTDQALKDLESIANRNNVSVYCIDARGLQIERQNKSSMDALNSAATESAKNQNTTAAVSKGQANSMNDAIDSIRMNTQENLASLAQSTGGVLIANTNDFRGPIRRIAEDIETYYELSYEPGNIDYDGSFHKITVKADQKDYKLQSRSGYFALPPSMTAGGEVVSAWEVPLLKAFDSTDMPKAFPFQASGLHYLNTEKQTVCTLVLDVPLSSITLNADPHSKLHKGGLSFLLLVKDPKGAVIKRMKNEIPLTVAPEKLDALKQSHFIYTEQFSVDPGRYLLEAAVSDKDGNRISARKVSMYVPPPASGIGLSSVAAIRSLKPKDDNTSATDPLLMANQVITPTLSPTVPSAQQQLPLYVVIYPDKASAEKPELIMQFSRDGQVIGNGRPAIGQPDAEGRIQYIADAPISKLGPGNYEVRFIAKQGAEAAQEFVTFTVAQ